MERTDPMDAADAMNRTDDCSVRRLARPDADDILEEMTRRQHLRPHQPVSQSLSDAAGALGFSPDVIGRALEWLQVDPAVAIGRLRRTQLTQLARCIHRFLRRGVPQNCDEVPAP